MGETNSDRRRHFRTEIPEITGTFHSPGDTQIRNLSLSGMSIEVTSEMGVGDHCFLELRHHGLSANVEVEVRWSSVLRVERQGHQLLPVFRAGVAFREILAEQKGGLFDWLVVDPLPDFVFS